MDSIQAEIIAKSGTQCRVAENGKKKRALVKEHVNANLEVNGSL